ncbi:NifU family protein [Candidatus Acetothermia bacterium]|jgi:Fe-S cluster biogenesis protein NfuA|nr:NifU family protein [Candidatus Acetothermia bacterium]MCI2426425.1 NifU family protein [Candidatus Acetothermia bacterium]MCI2427619.1 NifU family protein [Candidatus Acetothermia bacterium]MCI2428232.1 NifU family protein [Candidatus Acetothermia bacterium]
MRAKVTQALDEIRLYLQAHGGDIELVDVTADGVVQVRLTGACQGCPMSQYTLNMQVEAQLKEAVPQIKRVEAL